jgi:hypothetical protein
MFYMKDPRNVSSINPQSMAIIVWFYTDCVFGDGTLPFLVAPIQQAHSDRAYNIFNFVVLAVLEGFRFLYFNKIIVFGILW